MKFYLACRAGWNERATYREAMYGENYVEDRKVTVEVVYPEDRKELGY